MNTFNLIFDFLTVVALKAIAKLPTVNASLDSYVTILTDNLGIVNWFIPFNEIYIIFRDWCTSVVLAITVYSFIKLALKAGG